MMERGGFQGIATGLERIMDSTRFDLRETMDQFQGLCSVITAGRSIPKDIMNETRERYREIQDQLARIRGAKQLLEGKYRQYYRRDYQRDREIMEIAFLAKNLYLKFEYSVQEVETKSKLKDKEGHVEIHRPHIPFPWFQSAGNQIVLLRNLDALSELDYKTRFRLGFERRREMIQNEMRSISLFALSGEVTLMDEFQSRMRLREYDVGERYARKEFRGALTHLREVSPSEVQKVIRRFSDGNEFLRVKCLLLPIQSQKDLKKDILRSTEDMLDAMEAGEVKILSI